MVFYFHLRKGNGRVAHLDTWEMAPTGPCHTDPELGSLTCSLIALSFSKCLLLTGH